MKTHNYLTKVSFQSVASICMSVLLTALPILAQAQGLRYSNKGLYPVNWDRTEKALVEKTAESNAYFFPMTIQLKPLEYFNYNVVAWESQKVWGVRGPGGTVENLWDKWERTGKIDSRDLGIILADENYILSLYAEEAEDLIFLARHAQNSDDNANKKLIELVFSYLGEYKAQKGEYDEAYMLHGFYEAMAVALGHNPYFGRAVQEYAMDRVEACIRPESTPNCGWSAILLSDLAIPEDEAPYWTGAKEYSSFQRRIEFMIDKMNYLKNEQTDYMLTGVKNGVGATNQNVFVQLFLQSNNWFSAKDDDGVIKMFLTTGGLNETGRVLQRGEEAQKERFSSTGEVFYLAAPVPGTTGSGEFADSNNGRRHLILSYLVLALFNSYYHADSTNFHATGSQKMQRFVKDRIQLNAKKEFSSYLGAAFYGIRLGSLLMNAENLDGWEKESAALNEALYSNLKKGYGGTRLIITLQGACEVAIEWEIVGKVLKWGGKALKFGGKAATSTVRAGQRQVIKVLSPRSGAKMIMLDLTVKRAGKNVVRWSRQGVRNVLKKCGWKSKGTARK